MGFIIPLYQPSTPKPQEGGISAVNVTCRQCGESEWYDERELRSEEIPVARLRELYPEYSA
jgi:hypothetical protein